jgi:hypothetical protein
MSEAERLALMKAMQEAVERAKHLSKKEAIELLKREGIFDDDGRLKPEFGGSEERTPA